MRCSECGFDNPADTRFCTNCGAKLEAPAPPPPSPPPTTSTRYCPQCGSVVRPEARFCDRCGQDLSKEVVRPAPAAPQAPSIIVQGPPVTVQVAGAAPAAKEGFPLANTIAAGLGAIMMLVSLAVAWYTPRAFGMTGEDIKVNDLLNPQCFGPGCPNWAGLGLPIVLMIVFASLVLISVIYSFARRSATRSVWSSLGPLCALCVVGNAVYVLYYWYDLTRFFGQFEHPPEPGIWFNIVAAGCVMAFVGALVVMFSGAIGKRST